MTDGSHTVIVAHTSRITWAHQLQTTTNATQICMDDGTLGCFNNHLTAWQWHEANSFHGWAIVVEDDALPIPDFTHQLDLALTAAPPDASIISLYLGKARPPQYQTHVATAVSHALDDNHAWIISRRLLSAVAVAIRTDLVASLAAHLHRFRDLDIDEAITGWAGYKHMTAYTMPSLVDHRDTPTIAYHRDGQPRPPGRTAYVVGGRTNWNTPATPMRLE